MTTASFGGVRFEVSSDFDATLTIFGHSQATPRLARTERKILRLLMEYRGKVCTPRMFANELYPGKSATNLPDQKTIDVMVCHLRKKLCKCGLPDPIFTVWGRGYRFGEPVSAVPSHFIPTELQRPFRWIPRRKVEVLQLISNLEAQRAVMDFFSDLSLAELGEWRNSHCENGIPELRTTRAWLNI